MAFYRDLPGTFENALQLAKRILSTNLDLVRQGLIETEAEQLSIAAYREATGQPLKRMEFFSRLQDPYPEQAGYRVMILAGARAEGKPLQHLIGYQVFFEHEYEIGSGVLIPRPETELLLETVKAELSASQMTPSLAIEIGIGSGVLSIELLSRYPELKMVASELSTEAQKYALKNAKRILGEGPKGMERLAIVLAKNPLEVWEPFFEKLFSTRADFLVTNPPYLLPSDEIEAQVLTYEPSEALFAPLQDPLYFYRAIADQAGVYIKKGGLVFAELPHERAREVGDLFNGPSWESKILPDLTQRDRILVAKLKESYG